MMDTIKEGEETLMMSAEREKRVLVMGLLLANRLVYAERSIWVERSL